jgi:multidrug resistance efflux pump
MIKSFILCIAVVMANVSFATDEIKISGELQARDTDNFSPPRVERIWQYTVSFMAADGSVVKPGMPVLMFKTDEINRKLIEAQGKLKIKESEAKNNKANELENFEKKAIAIEEKKMQLEKAQRKAELPESVLAKNDYQENQLRLKLAQKQYDSSNLDYDLSQQKSQTSQQILETEIKKLNSDITKYTASISSMKMFAKAEGIVMHKTNWQGDKYAVGDSIWGNRRVVEVANLSKIIANIEIAENDIKHVDLNQKVKVKLDALPDMEFKGSITNISKVVRIKSKNQPSKILQAIVEIDKVDTEVMRPGMRLSATLINENASNPNSGSSE